MGIDPSALTAMDMDTAREHEVTRLLDPNEDVPTRRVTLAAAKASTDRRLRHDAIVDIGLLWPLPVGKSLIGERVERWNAHVVRTQESAEQEAAAFREIARQAASAGKSFEPPEPFYRALQQLDVSYLSDMWEGFPDDAVMGFALKRSGSAGELWIFGMLKRYGEPDHGSWYYSQPILRVTTLPGGEGYMKNLERTARHWYRKYVLNEVVVGRKPGTSRLLQVALREYREVVQEAATHARKKISELSARDIAIELQKRGVDAAESTVRNWLHDGELPRPEIIIE
jgi:hypothetical protein